LHCTSHPGVGRAARPAPRNPRHPDISERRLLTLL